MSHPKTIFGGALIGSSFTSEKEVQDLLDELKALQIKHIDTAARYAPGNPGGSERLLGTVGAAEQGFTIDTKIDTQGSSSGDGSGTLAPVAIEKSFSESLSRLQVDKVHVLYFHRPDPQTPLVEQAAEIQRQYQKGRFAKVGCF